MKKSISSILDNCQPEELDGLLTNIDADLPEEADADRIKALAMQKAGVKPRRPIRKLALIAACIALVAAVLVGCYVAEKAEYDSAVKFFDLNDLDTEGLSRDDIKRVYKDITTERFQREDSYELLSNQSAADRTDIVSINSSTDRIEGVDISITNNANNSYNGAIDYLGRSFEEEIDHGDIPDDTKYFLDYHFVKEVDGKDAWRIKIQDTDKFDNYYIADGKALVWTGAVYDQYNVSAMLIDDRDGTVLWQKELKSKDFFDDYAKAVITDNGHIVVLSIGTIDNPEEDKILVFRELDADGKIIREQRQSGEDIIFLDRLVPLSDGWLVEVSKEFRDSANSEDDPVLLPVLIKLDNKCAVVKEWILSEKADYTENKDIMEYQGKIYLSAQARPRESALYDNADYENLPENTDSLSDGMTDEWRDRAREEFSSVLYVFDPAGDQPERFYSVGGTLAGALCADDDGNLVWSVGRIVKCGWAPWANSFQLYGVTRRYEYTFDSGKNLLKQERTDIFNYFQR